MNISCNSTGNKASEQKNTSEQNDKAWISLFDGTTTSGWHTYGKDSAGKAWKAQDSTLHLDACPKIVSANKAQVSVRELNLTLLKDRKDLFF